MHSYFASLALLMEAPVTPPELVPVVHMILLGLATWLGLMAYQGRLELSESVCHKLVLIALCQGGISALRLVELGLGISAWPPLVALHSVLEVAVVTLVLYGIRRLTQAFHLPTRRFALLVSVALGGLFWGLMGGTPDQPLFHGNLVAVAFHLGFFMLTAIMLFELLLGELRADQKKLREHAEHMETAHTEIQQEAKEAVVAAEDKLRHYNELKFEIGQLRQRSRVLEQILDVSARINATRNMYDLLDHVVNAVRDILGFNMVLLRLYSGSTQAFEARAFAGIPEEGIAYLSGVQVTMEEFRKMTQSRFRISDSYFISHEDEGAADAIEGGYIPDLGERGDGEWHEDDALVVPLISNTGDTVGYLSVDDPVDRKVPSLSIIRQLEFLARQATTAIESAEVYDRLAKKNSELAQASEMLKNLGEMKSNFVANVSHELRTPLTSITAYTEILRESSENMPDDVRNEFLKVITSESGKLTTIIDDLLDLSRMEGGQSRVTRRDTDLTGLIRRLEENALKQAMDHEIDFRVKMSAEPIQLDADPVLLQQLLDHLLSNAFKFTDKGGSIFLSVENSAERVVLTVQDNGIGIPEEKMQYIFDRFYQVDGSSTRQHGGQGVGLALCQEIVQYHDGRIWAENVQPSGARFTVVLPRRERIIQGIGHNLPVVRQSDPTEFIDRLVHWIAANCDMEIVSLLVPDAAGEYLSVLAAIGLPESVVQSTRVRKGAGIVGKVWASGRSLSVSDVTTDMRFDKQFNDPKYTTSSLLSVPLLDGLDVIGVVNVNNRRDGKPSGPDDLILLESLAPRISSLLKQYRGHEMHNQRFAAVQNALRYAISLRHHDHNELTSICHEICLATARRLKLPGEEVEHLAFALRCYDIGLARISGQLLRKTTPLTSDERQRIQQHVAASLEILAPLQIPSKVRQIILHHHERYDGGGYPDGLEGEAIPIGARLVTLTDSLHAMLQDRPYRSALGLETILSELENEAGRQFCPRLVEPFLVETKARVDVLRRLQMELQVGKGHLNQVGEPVGIVVTSAVPSSSQNHKSR